MDNEKVVEEQGLTISDLFFLVKRNILLIIIITFIFGLAGAVYGLKLKKPTYSATTTAIVMISNNSTTNPTQTSDYVYATYYTSAFISFIKSNPVLNAAKEELAVKGYDISREVLSDAISVSTQSNSLIITVTAKVASGDDNEGREMAREIANTVLQCAKAEGDRVEVDDQGNPKTETVTINGQQVTQPVYTYKVFANNLIIMELVEDNADVEYSRGAFTIMVIAVLLGVVLSFGIILIKYLVNDTFTSKESFENTFGINVLAVIAEITEIEEGGKK